MILLHFAHGAEASEFIKAMGLKPTGDGIYLGQKYSLVIGGEGIYNTFINLTKAAQITKAKTIINMGIAGAMDKSINLNDIISVRTVYGHNEQTPRFHSFTTSEKESTYDCITTEDRVLNESLHEKLCHFAPLVDRELWAVGMVAKKLKLPFFSYKMISDFAKNNKECLDIKERASFFSIGLFNFFSNLKLEQKDQVNEEQIKEDPTYPLQMSFYNQKQYSKLLTKLLRKKIIESEKELLIKKSIKNVLEENSPVKQKVQKLLAQMNRILNPIDSIIQQKMSSLFMKFNEKNISIKLDPKLEKRKFTINCEINSQANIDNLKDALVNFEFKNIEDFWDGDFDV